MLFLKKMMTSPPQQFTNLDVLDKFDKAFDLKKPKILIVGLCGGQGAGKTKLSKILSKNIKNSAIIEEKSYYKKMPSKRKLSYEVQPLFDEYGGYSKERKLLLVDLSNPSSYNYESLYQNLLSLKEPVIRFFLADFIFNISSGSSLPANLNFTLSTVCTQENGNPIPFLLSSV